MSDDFRELEQLLDRRLRSMPAPRAPQTLVPRVMRAVRGAAPAAAPAGWMAWPLVWRAASLAALVLVALGVVRIWPAIDATLALAWSNVANGLAGPATSIGEFVSPFLTAGRVLWRVIVEPVGLFLVVFVAVMGTACAAFWTAFGRVALGPSTSLGGGLSTSLRPGGIAR